MFASRSRRQARRCVCVHFEQTYERSHAASELIRDTHLISASLLSLSHPRHVGAADGGQERQPVAHERPLRHVRRRHHVGGERQLAGAARVCDGGAGGGGRGRRRRRDGQREGGAKGS